MFVEQLGVPVEQREFGIWGEHDELDRHAIAPVGQGVDISGQRQQLHADELLDITIRESLHERCRVLSAHDDLASAVSGDKMDRDVIHHHTHSLHHCTYILMLRCLQDVDRKPATSRGD